MSERDESDDGDDDEEEDEDEDDEENENESDNEEKDEVAEKAAAVQADVEILNSIFHYLDGVEHRMNSRRNLLATIESLQADNVQLEARAQRLQQKIDQQEMEIARLSRGEEVNEDFEIPEARWIDQLFQHLLVLNGVYQVSF